MRDGKPFRLAVQHAEKIYQTYRLEVTDRGGHSAAPRRDNAIYRLAEALRRLAQFDFPPRLNAVTRAFFERMAASETPAIAEAIRALLAGRTDAEALAPLTSRPDYNAQIRTTCVATMLEAGHAENALPQIARATVNCRILPDQSRGGRPHARPRDRRRQGRRSSERHRGDEPALADQSGGHADRSRSCSIEMWPGIPVITTMSAGDTDNRWLRNAGIPAYGVSGLFSEPGNNGVHGRNERVGVKAVFDSKRFFYRLVKQLAGIPVGWARAHAPTRRA